MVVVLGARQVGKSTLLEQVAAAEGAGRELLTLDRQPTRAAAQADPAGFVAGLRTPVAIDEIQRVPKLMTEIKLRVDRDTSPGQFAGLRSRAHARVRSSGEHAGMDAIDLTVLRVPHPLRERVAEILAVTDDACNEHLDIEYAQCCRVLVGRLARKRPSPLTRGDTAIWAAGAIYAIGQVNFLFDRSQRPHLTSDQLAERLGVVKTTMANKAGMINRLLEINIFEPELSTSSMLEQHPLAWIIEVDGFLVDVRTLPEAIQTEARRLGLVPDLEARRAA